VTTGIDADNASIIIPSTGLAEFQKLLDEMIKASNELPEKNQPEK
jgi:hypothetical protein